jgi:hypothetical protein
MVQISPASPENTLFNAIISLFSYKLQDEILKPLGTSCARDNECQSTCCYQDACGVIKDCEESRNLIVMIFSVVCMAIIIGGIVAYCVCMKKRRTTIYDERLNSVIDSQLGSGVRVSEQRGGDNQQRLINET